MARFDLMDFEWSVIQPLLPNKPRVVPRVDDRRALNGIFWRLRTGLRGRTSPIVRGAADDQNPRPGRRQRAADRPETDRRPSPRWTLHPGHARHDQAGDILADTTHVYKLALHTPQVVRSTSSRLDSGAQLMPSFSKTWPTRRAAGQRGRIEIDGPEAA